MLDAIQEIHSVGRILRDLKPDDIRVHEGKIYLIDFATIIKFKDMEGNILITDRQINFIGSLKYASINALSSKMNC